MCRREGARDVGRRAEADDALAALVEPPSLAAVSLSVPVSLFSVAAEPTPPVIVVPQREDARKGHLRVPVDGFAFRKPFVAVAERHRGDEAFSSSERCPSPVFPTQTLHRGRPVEALAHALTAAPQDNGPHRLSAREGYTPASRALRFLAVRSYRGGP